VTQPIGAGAGAVGDPAAPAPATPSAPDETVGGRRRTARRHTSGVSGWIALLWLAPALALILGVVVWPAVELVRASLSRYSITGLRKGDAGFDNFRNVLANDSLTTVLTNTVVWVVAVVALTILISLGVAQFLTKEFWGRRIVRWAVIVPWAASLVITARLFSLIYSYYYGTLNAVLLKLHVIDTPIDFIGSDRLIMPSMIAVGVFVSIPFTAYVFVAGLNAIPGDVYEAARIDGASAWQTWRQITLPLLRPAILVATVLNMIYVFNSFPIIYTLNESNPGFGHDTTITFMYKLAFKSAEKDVGQSAAAGLFNVCLILVAVLLYLRVSSWREEES
jgi:multiple sugar transport system permease protein